MKDVYRACLLWGIKDDALIRAAWLAVMGSPLIIKAPVTDRWEHDQLIFTNIMTEDRKTRLLEICGRKLKILEKPPLGFWGVNGLNYG